MRIMLRGSEMSALERTLKAEGDKIVVRDPELVLTTIHEDINAFECPVVGGDYTFPSSILTGLGIRNSHPADFYLFRWFDRSWRPQTFIGLPLQRLLDRDLGPRVEVGITVRATHHAVDPTFDRPELVEILSSMNYIGFVSLGVSFEVSPGSGDSVPYAIRSVHLGVPSYGLYAVLEGIRGRRREFFTGEEPLVQENWLSAYLLSRWPWPFETKLGRADLKGLTDDTSRHLWPLNMSTHRHVSYTDSGEVAVATGWAETISECHRRVLRTLWSIDLENRQFRTDLTSTIMGLWRRVQVALGIQ